MLTSRKTRLTAYAVALATSVAIALPGLASADTPNPSPLAAAISTLTSNGGDSLSLQAAEAIDAIGKKNALGDVPSTSAASPTDLMGAYQTAVKALQAMGINPFLYPTAAPFCSGGSPLGLAPAVAGAVPGPWPNMQVLGQPLNAVSSGQTLFAFVPGGIAKDGADTSGMQVAWFNVNTFQGGFVPMGTLGDVAKSAVPGGIPAELQPVVAGAISNFLNSVVPLGGVRAVPVQTGSGTVLAAIFGTVQNGASSCFFLPTVGITTVK
ncbi:hypothetical protein FOS14_12465 [Skermania sp. ID1734]|uniref:hypothetical protein n=1 Tax=Skermania sp. ID1734 TaxID=2597516 RepID=UPI00117CF60C|nr:hypothetical protein [Skermania sp. ID1734]TSD99180.1 hypothetical protein FOS14_12465 [Skermania sp. ID1734]